MKSEKLLEARRKILEILKETVKELKATIYLFGSYAREDHVIDSDIDIVVVSGMFEGIKFFDRIELVRKLLPQDLSFDIIPLTPHEFQKKKDHAFHRDVSRYWIKISPDPES